MLAAFYDFANQWETHQTLNDNMNWYFGTGDTDKSISTDGDDFNFVFKSTQEMFFKDSGGDLYMVLSDGATDRVSFYAGAASAQLQVEADGVELDNGVKINEFSDDGTMAGDSDSAVPTEKAVSTFVSSLAAVRVDTTLSAAQVKALYNTRLG